jgi:phosphohistidine phosphatase SixA
MSRRLFILTLACVAAGPFGTVNAAGEESFWSALKSGGYVVLLRHAVTEPGIGDPPNFKLGDCGTQRNLSAKGRADAQRIGKAFRARGIPVQDVLSSRWCRCIDTAQLAFERVKPEPTLDSMFNEPEGVRKEKARAVFASLAGRTSPGNLILVTHAQNIQELTGISPSSGELIVVALEGTDRLKVIGRLEVQSI